MIGADARSAGAARDGRGRFVDAFGATKRPRRGSSAGVRGPTYLSDKPKLELARTLARLMLVLERLRIELEGGTWGAPVRRTRANMAGIEKAKKEMTKATLAALDETLRDLAEERAERSPTDIARRMTARLGRPFGVASLYRAPLDTVWREPRDYLGAAAEVDGTAEMQTCMRLTKRLIVYHIGRIRPRIAEAEEVRRKQLLEGNAIDGDGEDWTPIVLGDRG